MTIHLTPESPWTGWHRRNRQTAWRAIVQAESEAEAWDLLLAHSDGGDKCALPSGRRPDDRQRALFA